MCDFLTIYLKNTKAKAEKKKAQRASPKAKEKTVRRGEPLVRIDEVMVVVLTDSDRHWEAG